MRLPGILAAAAFAIFGPAAAAAPRPPLQPRLAPRSIPASHTVHERRGPRHTEGWVRRELADSTAVLPVRIGLQQSNLDRGHDLLMDISSPTSPNYGRHLTSDEVVQFFAPKNESVDAVREWLVSAGVPAARISQSVNRQWIQFDATVQEAEDLLFTTFHVYEHAESGVRNIGCREYHVPSDVRGHIDYVTPGIKLLNAVSSSKPLKRAKRGKLRRKRQFEYDIVHTNNIDADPSLTSVGPCSLDVTPTCVRNQYQIPNGTKASPGNELGIFQSLSQHYNQQDLDTYFDNIAPWVPNGSHPELRSINGAEGPTTNQDAAGEEADLDFEVAMPLVWPQKTVLWQTDDEWYQLDQTKSTTKYLGFFNTFFDAIDGSYCNMSAFGEQGRCTRPSCLDPEYPNPNADSGYQLPAMCGAHAPTNVISISYSGVEAGLPASYMRRQCLEVMKLALQGVTVVQSSGDYGVGGRRYDSRAGCLGPNRDVYSPRMMSNCPYVLSVGATVLVDDDGGGGNATKRDARSPYREVAPTMFASGGGFSNVFGTPSWQKRHVGRYLCRANVTQRGYVSPGDGQLHDDDDNDDNDDNDVGNVVGAQPEKVFNRAGRGYPDVAAVGDNYVVHMQGMTTRLAGTSVAVPVWASILTLINEERLAVGKGPVGFVHPVLYDHPEVFTDITTGSNPGCGSEGFPVKKGWDPVTGLGSPIYPKLLELFMSLP